MTPKAKIWEESMDPSDEVNFEVDLSPQLIEGESVATFTLDLPAESLLYGLTLGTTTREAFLTGDILTIWLTLTEDPIDLVTLPIEITFVTDSVPSRTKQRTVAVKVEQL